jgi:hypothetical protein
MTSAVKLEDSEESTSLCYLAETKSTVCAPIFLWVHTYCFFISVVLRGWKGDVYEGGTRVPGLVHNTRYETSNYLFFSLPKAKNHIFPLEPPQNLWLPPQGILLPTYHLFLWQDTLFSKRRCHDRKDYKLDWK